MAIETSAVPLEALIHELRLVLVRSVHLLRCAVMMYVVLVEFRCGVALIVKVFRLFRAELYSFGHFFGAGGKCSLLQNIEDDMV